MKYLLDTDTFSEIVRARNPRLLQRIEGLTLDQFCLSVVTLAEIRFGEAVNAPPVKIRERIAAVADAMHHLPMPVAAALPYAQVRAHLKREGTPIGPNDLWLAAHALAADLTLVTGNQREFARVPKLRVENWVR